MNEPLEETSETSEKSEDDYCARCGERMSLVTTNRRGITQYVSRWNGCGYEK